jgi:prophage regulatory protein
MQILSSAEVSKLTSISRSHLHRMAREGDFPKPLKISRRRSGWLKEDVEAWISECVRKHRIGGNS